MSEKRTLPLPFDPSTVDLDALLKRLNLANTRRMWRTLIERAENDGWSCRDFLAVLVSEEVSHRQQTRLQRAVHQARFPFLKTIDDFDFSLQTTLRRQLLGSYLGPELVSEGRNLILLGKSGRGKTHLVIAIAYKAIQNGFTAFFTTAAALIEDLSVATTRGKLREALALYLQPHLLVIDEVGYLSVGPDAANVLFHLVNERHLRRRPLLFTTNKSPLTEWGDVLHDHDLAEAIVDRVLERGRLLTLDGPSYRTRHLGLDSVGKPRYDAARVSGKKRPEFPEPTEGIRPLCGVAYYQCRRRRLTYHLE
jgi:DNA replication protein DnaC